jgi:hypothetical protein
MPLRIACDLDGTVADMRSALQREAERLFGPDVDLRAIGPVQESLDAAGEGDAQPEGGSGNKKGLTGPQRRELWSQIQGINDFWTTLLEIEPGALARLSSLVAIHRWEVVFLTQRSRTSGETVQRQSHRWLEANGFERPSVFVMRNGSRGKLADALALDVVIDDHPANCLDVATDSKARPILVWREDPAGAPGAAARFGMDIVHSFGDALTELEAMTAAASKPPGLVGRVRTAFGI